MNSEAFSEGPATSNRPLTGRGGNERLPHNSKAAKAWAALTEAIAKRARLWKRRLGVSHYQKRLTRIFAAVIAIVLLKVLLLDSKPSTAPGEIEHPALLERLTANAPLLSSSKLDARKYDFLRARIGRDERPDLFVGDIKAGREDFWARFQLPFATNTDTMHLDEQVIRGVVEDLMSFNGWQAATCSSLIRPFGSHTKSHNDDFSDLSLNGERYYFALVLHSADTFMIDQLAVIIQTARRLGPSNVFVSLLDYGSTDATPFLCDLTEMVFILLNIPFRIRRVPTLTSDPTAAYYPMEEAYARNLALEPLMELYHRRQFRFNKVIWLKGFACPTDILESLRLSHHNHAAMVCSMDWKEHNKNYVFNDRWRSRDLDGNLFRGSKSTAPLQEAPVMEAEAQRRYGNHEPFQVFCCESGVHIVDPAQSYYEGISYRSGIDQGVFNASDATEEKAPKWSEGPCMDGAQTHFCRDLWLLAARKGVNRVQEGGRKDKQKGLSSEWEAFLKRVKPFKEQQGSPSAVSQAEGQSADAAPSDASDAKEAAAAADAKLQAEIAAADAAAAALPEVEDKGPRNPAAALEDLRAEWAKADAEGFDQTVDDGEIDQAEHEERRLRKRAGQDSDAEAEVKSAGAKAVNLGNAAFEPARILVNPHCLTTYGGVSHTKLALELFGQSEDDEDDEIGTSPAHKHGYLLRDDEWRPAPETFVCQEMRTTGGRLAPKQQRRSGFYIAKALQEGWQPNNVRKW